MTSLVPTASSDEILLQPMAATMQMNESALWPNMVTPRLTITCSYHVAAARVATALDSQDN